MNPNRVFLATESLAAQNSGISRVARLMARALHESLHQEKRIDGVSLSDADTGFSGGSWNKPCGGRRWEYVLRVQTGGFRSSAIFYDSLSMARAHFMGPARLRPSLAWMHGVEVWEEAWPVHLSVARRVDCLVTNSGYTHRRASALHVGLERARICWLGTETDEPASLCQNSHQPPTVLILARLDLESYKGHRELIEVWPEVARRVPGARLLIAGGGLGLDRIGRLVQQSPVAPSIQVTGYVAETMLPSLFQQANVFAMPSRGEGFGLVYIEAMRHGIPVIASLQDAGQEINLQGVTGYNVDVNKPQDLVEALATLLTDQTKARTLGAAGQERWRRHFTWSAFRDRFAPIVYEITSRSRSPETKNP